MYTCHRLACRHREGEGCRLFHRAGKRSCGEDPTASSGLPAPRACTRNGGLGLGRQARSRQRQHVIQAVTVLVDETLDSRTFPFSFPTRCRAAWSTLHPIWWPVVGDLGFWSVSTLDAAGRKTHTFWPTVLTDDSGSYPGTSPRPCLTGVLLFTSKSLPDALKPPVNRHRQGSTQSTCATHLSNARSRRAVHTTLHQHDGNARSYDCSL